MGSETPAVSSVPSDGAESGRARATGAAAYRCPASNPAILIADGGEQRLGCGCCGSAVYAICRQCGAPVSAVETTLSRRGAVVKCAHCLALGDSAPAWEMPEAIRQKLEDDDRVIREATLRGLSSLARTSQSSSPLRRLWALFRRS